MRTEFSCEDDGGLWLDESCNEATSDGSLFCRDNEDCEGYCYVVKHPKAVADDTANGFGQAGTCSSHMMPITCARTIEKGNVVELCR